VNSCCHDFKYGGVVNVTQGEVALGAIDVWVCSRCSAVDVAARVVGDIGVSTRLGFRPLSREGGRWVILVCRRGGSPSWEVHQLGPSGGRLRHNCVRLEEIEVDADLKLSDAYRGDHELFSVEEYVNKTLILR